MIWEIMTLVISSDIGLPVSMEEQRIIQKSDAI